jgi:hypothetical protein
MIQLFNFYLDLMLWMFEKQVRKNGGIISSGKHQIIFCFFLQVCVYELVLFDNV